MSYALKHRYLSTVTRVLILLSLCLLVLSFLVFEHSRGDIFFSWQRRTLTNITHEIGFAYQSPLGQVLMSSHSKPSPAKLLENGIELGAANSIHDDIRRTGRGKFSFWYDCLYFSPSDNTDPRTNNRKYEILWPTPISKWFSRVLYLLTLSIAFFSCTLAIKDFKSGPKVIGEKGLSKGVRTFLKEKRQYFSLLLKSRYSSKISLVLILISLILFLISFLILEHTRGQIILSWQRKPIISISIINESGFAYQSPLGRVWMSSHRKPSPAKLFENGIELGAANSIHDDIRRTGRGKFSFWYDCLYFSPSDNTDPRTNNRKYEILWPTPISKWFSIGLYFLTLVIVSFTAVHTIQVVKAKLENVKEDVSIIQKLNVLFKRKDSFCLSLLYFALCLGCIFLSYSFYIVFNKPVRVLGSAETIFIYTIVYLIWGGLGFLSARFFSLGQKVNLKVIIKLIAIFGVVFFLVLRSEIINSIFELVHNVSFFVIMIVIGIFSFYLNRGHKIAFAFRSLTHNHTRWVLALIIIFIATMAIPGLVKPLIESWDISGYMDSQMYDVDAHRIVTGEVPQGSPFVMPLYQYGMAFFYYIFGHFFYVQQIINGLLFIAAIVLLCLTSWNLFRNLGAVIITGVLSAFTKQLYSYVIVTQIENWYIPLICLIIFMWSCYWRRPSLSHLIFLGISIGLAFNCRAQGTFFFAFLCLTPFFIAKMSIKERLVHSSIIVLVVGISLLPWSIRNYIYENRFSPTSDQAIIVTINDHRIGFYGLRHEFFYNKDLKKYENKGGMAGFNEVYKEYLKKYSNKKERNKAIQKDALKNTLSDPVWTAKAVFWRTLSLYGLLPPGIWDPEGPKPTDWSMHWQGYIYNGFPSLFFISFSLLGLLMRPERRTLFLFLAVASNIAITIFAPAVESRLGYPLLPLHMILGMCIFFKPFSDDIGRRDCTPSSFIFSDNKKIYLAFAIFSIAIFFILCHLTVGKDNIYRPLIEKATVKDCHIKINPDIPSLNDYYKWLNDKKGSPPVFNNGDRVRLRCKVTNYMLPPKKYGSHDFLPAFASDPSRENFYYAYPLEGGIIGMTYFGTSMNTQIREGDIVEIEGIILLYQRNTTLSNLDFWLKAEKILLIERKSPSS